MKTLKIKIAQGVEKDVVKYCSKIVFLASQFESEVILQTEPYKIDAKSILGLMSLLVCSGKEIEFKINGIDEEECWKKMYEGL